MSFDFEYVIPCTPGTLVNLAAGGGERDAVTFGHPSGTLKVGAEAVEGENGWTVNKVVMSRSARVLMEGWVRIPEEFIDHSRIGINGIILMRLV